MRDLKIEQRPANRQEDSLFRYLNDLGNHPLLRPEEEALLAKKIKEGDERALNRLVRANLRFVISVAKTYSHIGVPIADLINEGNIGLIRAARSFDETKGFKFISYAVWYIRSSMILLSHCIFWRRSPVEKTLKMYFLPHQKRRDRKYRADSKDR